MALIRPDLSFLVNKVCQFLHAPTIRHWSVVKRILRYAKFTLKHGLKLFRKTLEHGLKTVKFPMFVSAFSDVD